MAVCRLIELPSGVPVAIKAVVPDPSPSDPPLYHTWGVLNHAYPAFEPHQFPLELETRFEELGIHLLFNPQRLRPEWLDTISVSGVCDIVFRSTTDLLRYQDLQPSAKPSCYQKFLDNGPMSRDSPSPSRKPSAPSGCSYTMSSSLPPPWFKLFSTNTTLSGMGMTRQAREHDRPTTSASKLMTNALKPHGY